MTHLHSYTKAFFRLLRGIQPQSKFQAHFPKADICKCALLPGLSPNEAPRPPPLASGHLSAGSNSRPRDSRVLASVSQQGTRRCSGTEIHAQHSAGMPHSTASLLTGTHGAAFGGEKKKKKKMRRGARSAAGVRNPPDGGDRSYIRPLSTEARMVQSEQITAFPLRRRENTHRFFFSTSFFCLFPTIKT